MRLTKIKIWKNQTFNHFSSFFLFFFDCCLSSFDGIDTFDLVINRINFGLHWLVTILIYYYWYFCCFVRWQHEHPLLDDHFVCCKKGNTAYVFGRGGGLLVYKYQNFDQYGTTPPHLQSMQVSLATLADNCTFFEISSDRSGDLLQLRVHVGHLEMWQRTSEQTHRLLFKHWPKINNGQLQQLTFTQLNLPALARQEWAVQLNRLPVERLPAFQTLVRHPDRLQLGSILPNAVLSEQHVLKVSHRMPFAPEVYEYVRPIESILSSHHLLPAQELIDQKYQQNFAGIILNVRIDNIHPLELHSEHSPKVKSHGNVRLLFRLPAIDLTGFTLFANGSTGFTSKRFQVTNWNYFRLQFIKKKTFFPFFKKKVWNEKVKKINDSKTNSLICWWLW